MWVRIPLAWLMNLTSIKHLNKNNNYRHNSIKYSIKLTSIFAPSFASNSSLKINVYSQGSYLKKNKIMVKQSYMILTWLSYLSKIGSGAAYKIEDDWGDNEKSNIPLFFVCPLKQSKLTTIKAPMAHKTFSQEQFKFRYYSFNISFNINSSSSVLNINSLNKSLYLALLIRGNFLNFSTNMMFVKRFRASLPVTDATYLCI